MNYNNTHRGGVARGYTTPTIEVLDLATEAGFAASQQPNFGNEGDAGSGNENDYGDF